MNVLRRFLLTAALAAVFLSIPSLAQKVETDYDHSVNFAQVHTYSWGHVHATDPLFEGRIREAVDRDLQAKGWQQVPTGGDVTLTAVAIGEKPGRIQHLLQRTGAGLEMAWLGRRHGHDHRRKYPCRNPGRRYL